MERDFSYLNYLSYVREWGVEGVIFAIFCWSAGTNTGCLIVYLKYFQCFEVNRIYRHQKKLNDEI